MIEYANYFVEQTLKRDLAMLKTATNPAAELAFLIPNRISATDRLAWATRVYGAGILIRRGLTPTSTDWRPTIAVVQESGGSDGTQPLGLGTQLVNDTDGNPRVLSVIPGMSQVRIILMSNSFDDVRVLMSFTFSAIATMATWLLGSSNGSGSGLTNLVFAGMADIVPDESMLPEGVVQAVGSSLTFMFSGMNVTPHIGAFTGTVSEFLSIA